MTRRTVLRSLFALLFGATASATTVARAELAPAPGWLRSAVVYTVYPQIFSPRGDLAGVTAQLPRLKKLGINVLWLMPVTPVGQPSGHHPAFDSPYCVRDYYAIDPRYGSAADLRGLVATAHRLGIKVILDVVLNHTSWDNPLIRHHPEYYVHTDANPKNSASIREAFSFADVAQLDYANPSLRQYMTHMLGWWVTRYDIDGFRFDSASNPAGASRKIPADYWKTLPQALRKVKPDLLLLGECEDPELARAPFALDYGWNVADGLKRATNGESADAVRVAWQRQTDTFPRGMLHLSLQDTWDTPDRDIRLFGSPAGAMAAAVFNFTINGVPLVYNGMEVGNGRGSVNPHVKIDWTAPHPQFPAFYRELIGLRQSNPALQQGAVAWLPNSAPDQVLAYTRSGSGSEFLILINTSDRPVHGRVSAPVGAGWVEVTPSGAPGRNRHALPPSLALGPRDFAIFRRATKAP